MSRPKSESVAIVGVDPSVQVLVSGKHLVAARGLSERISFVEEAARQVPLADSNSYGLTMVRAAGFAVNAVEPFTFSVHQLFVGQN